MRRPTGWMMLIVTLAWALPAPAAVYFAENFNDLPVGDLQDGQTSTGGSWVILDNHDDNLNVVADPTGSGRGNVLHVTDRSDADFTRLRARMSADVTVPIRVRYDFYVNDIGATNTSGLWLTTLDSGSASNTAFLTYINYASSDNAIRNYDGVGDVHEVVTGLDYHTWYSVTITLPAPNSGATTYRLKVQHGQAVLLDADVDLRSPTAPAYRDLFFRQGSAAHESDIYYDNIQISDIPEPVSGSIMMFLGAAGLLRRRR